MVRFSLFSFSSRLFSLAIDACVCMICMAFILSPTSFWNCKLKNVGVKGFAVNIVAVLFVLGHSRILHFNDVNLVVKCLFSISLNAFIAVLWPPIGSCPFIFRPRAMTSRILKFVHVHTSDITSQEEASGSVAYYESGY